MFLTQKPDFAQVQRNRWRNIIQAAVWPEMIAVLTAHDYVATLRREKILLFAGPGFG
jgi:hypothetical protein